MSNPVPTKPDFARMKVDEEYFEHVMEQIDQGYLKLTDEEYSKFQLALHVWNMKNMPPSQDPKDHENAVDRVRRVGLSKFFQDLSDFFR